MHEISLTAYRQDEEPRRIERLERVLSIAAVLETLTDAKTHDPALASGDDEPNFSGDVLGLYDHKGTLTVTFRTIEAAEYFAPTFLLAWRAMNECLVEVECGHWRKRVGLSLEAA